MNYFDIREKVKQLLPDKRFLHTQGVADTAAELAEHYGVDAEKAKLAGILHDCAKEVSREQAIEIFKKFGLVIDDISLNNPKLLHGPVGACMAQYELGIDDIQILDAIWFHTTAKSNMNILTKIIYIADFIEPNRNYEGVDALRKLAYEDINSAIIVALGSVTKKVIDLGGLVHPDSIHARNFLIMERENNQN